MARGHQTATNAASLRDARAPTEQRICGDEGSLQSFLAPSGQRNYKCGIPSGRNCPNGALHLWIRGITLAFLAPSGQRICGLEGSLWLFLPHRGNASVEMRDHSSVFLPHRGNASVELRDHSGFILPHRGNASVDLRDHSGFILPHRGNASVIRAVLVNITDQKKHHML
jgi:hypothetical protein